MIKKIGDLVCDAIAKKGYKYDIMSYEDSFDIFFNDYGEDQLLNYHFEIVGNPKIVVLTCKLPFESKKIDMAMATSVVNDFLINGGFDYDISNGGITYRIATCWTDEIKDSEPFLYLIEKAQEDIKTYGSMLKDVHENKLDYNSLKEKVSR